MKKHRIMTIFGALVVLVGVSLFVLWKKQEADMVEVQKILDELLPMYHEAERMQMGTNIETENRTVEINGHRYLKIISDQYNSVADIRNQMRTVYTEEYIDKYCKFEGNGAWYVDYENEVYRLEADGFYVNLSKLQKVIKKAEEHIIVQMQVEESDSCAMIYMEKEAEGWRINQIVW